MSSRREVLSRILALLQRKTLIKPKTRTLKCLKRHYLTVRSIKNVAVLTEDGAFALFFRPHPGEFDSSRVPTPGNLPSKAKKMLMPGGQPGGGWAQVELTDALIASIWTHSICQMQATFLWSWIGTWTAWCLNVRTVKVVPCERNP